MASRTDYSLHFQNKVLVLFPLYCSIIQIISPKTSLKEKKGLKFVYNAVLSSAV